MLQIISGRFFGNGTVEEQDTDAVLYSNLSWIAPISTAVMELRPAGGFRQSAVSSYVLRYKNRLERDDGPLVLADSNDAVDQFRLVASFWFKAFFHTDHQKVELLCRQAPRNPLDRTVPSTFIPRFFDAGLRATAAEVEGFPPFMSKVLKIPRRSYVRTTACFGAFFDALEAIGSNYDLAYSMLVYVLEALCQTTDGSYVPVWMDYDQGARMRLEAVLDRLTRDDRNEIQEAILSSTHLKRKKRFVAFVVEHTTDVFFTSEAEQIPQALPRSQLLRALQNLYASRSGFVHQLTRVREQLRIPSREIMANDFIEWEQQPYFTFAGLVRLTHHVLKVFIDRQEVLEREDYSKWRHELPGLVRVQFAPQYWIWKTERFTPATSRRHFSGLMEHLVAMFPSKEWTLVDMSGIMEKIENLVPKCREVDRLSLVALYWLYHLLSPKRRDGWKEFLTSQLRYCERCSIETMAIWAFHSRARLPWAGDECGAVFEDYLEQRHKLNAVSLPREIDVSIMAQIANLWVSDVASDRFCHWLDRAIFDAAGKPGLQAYLNDCKCNRVFVNPRIVFGLETSQSPVVAGDAPTV